MESITTVLFHTAVVSKVRLLKAIEYRISGAAFTVDMFNNIGDQANESPQDNQEDYISTVEDDIF
jgi:hypothetical protein